MPAQGRLAGRRWRFSLYAALPMPLTLALLVASSVLAGAQGDSYGKEVSPDLDAVYERGLACLAKSQSPNGSWSHDTYGALPGVVGMAAMAMLAHGDDPNFGPYADNLRRAFGFILSKAGPDGYIGRDNHSSMYSHAFATLAMAEAYGQLDDPRLGPALNKAVKILLKAQSSNPTKAWRYTLDARDADTSVSGAVLMALLSARNAGIEVPDSSIEGALGFFKACYTPSEGNWGYASAGGGNYPRAGIGVLMLSLTGQTNAPERLAGLRYIMANVDNPDPNYLHYAKYYCSQAVFHAGGQEWEKWNAMNFAELKSFQAEDGSWSGQFGKTCTTSFALLSLALNYRYLPIYERKLPGPSLRLLR